MVRGSHVSCQSALASYGLIPEHVPITTSVTTRRPGRWTNPLGTFDYRHIKVEMFDGYQSIDLAGGQQAFVASAEKALVDLIYLTPDADSPAYL